MPGLRYSEEAKDDLRRIAIIIAQDKPIAARNWVSRIREKCRLLAKHPDIGELRRELGEDIRSTYVGSYVIFFRRTDRFLDIVRIIRGDRDTRLL